MKPLIGITDYVRPPHDVESQAFPEAEFVFLDQENEQLFDARVLKDLDGLIVWHAHVGEFSARRLPRCRIVVRYGVGYDLVDVGALRAANILFCNTPDYGTEEVADTACAMILNLQRKVSRYDFACRQYDGGWQEHVEPPLKRTNRSVLGVIGVGRIGTAVVNRMKPFGYRIVGYDPYVPSGHEKVVGYHRVGSLQQLTAESDILTIHTPLTPETRGLVDASFLASMKKGASLVNTARGGIVKDFQCVEMALRSGQLSSVAFDVLPGEPPPDSDSFIRAWKDHTPWLRGRVLINPHVAYYSEQALFEMRYKAAETARLFLLEKKKRNVIVE